MMNVRIRPMKHNLLICAAMTLFATLVHAADEPPDVIKLRMGAGSETSGRNLSELCQGCHGENGYSVDDMAPNLAGQYAAYITKEIIDFQSGARTHQIMSGVATTVNDAELKDIAAYFASQEKMHGDGTGDNPVGKKLFLNGDVKRRISACVNCHGVNGKGLSPYISAFPVIGGQRRGYLRVQLQHWRSGERHNSFGGVMNMFAGPLTDAEIDALADYISGL